MENNCCNLCEGCMHRDVCEKACDARKESEGEARDIMHKTIIVECPDFLDVGELTQGDKWNIAQEVYDEYEKEMAERKAGSLPMFKYRPWLHEKVGSLDSAIKKVREEGS